MPNPPPPPDYLGYANSQGQANLDAARWQNRINNPSVSNWMGSQTVTYGPNGEPMVNQTLDPRLQQLYGQYLGTQGQANQIAGGLLGSIGSINSATLGPSGEVLDPNALPSMPGSYGDVRNQVIDAMMGRSNRELNQRGEQMNADLIARGLRPGTEAYTRELDSLNRQRNDALQQAQIAGGNAATQAIQSDLARRGMGASEQAQRFGQQFGNRGQRFGEQLQGQQLSLSQIQSLMNGSRPNMPNFQPYQGGANVAPSPLYGAGVELGRYNTDVWNSQQQQRNSLNNGLFGLGNSALNYLGSPGGANLLRLLGNAGGSAANYLGGLFNLGGGSTPNVSDWWGEDPNGFWGGFT